jgi:serine/threonine protein phosphatase PrpC
MDKNYFAITDTGKVRDNNEDAFIAEKTTDGELIIACVIDGVGGYAGGEIASEIARKSIIRQLNIPNGNLPTQMKSAIVQADEEILAEKLKVKGHENMACVLTLVVADLPGNQFHYAHVGDTRLYLLRDNSLVKISKDQSFVGFMEDSGRITEEQAMAHPKRNEINKALGFGQGLATQPDYIEMGSSPFLPGDMLLVCSDGLSDMLTRQEITDILTGTKDLHDMGEKLVRAANQNGGRDNITLVLVKNDKEAMQYGATKPLTKTLMPVEPAVATASNTGHLVINPPMDHSVAAIRKRRITIIVLSILCLLLFGSTAYLLWEKYTLQTNTPAATLQPYQYPAENLLPDTLKSDTLQSDTLKRTTDSLSTPVKQ